MHRTEQLDFEAAVRWRKTPPLIFSPLNAVNVFERATTVEMTSAKNMTVTKMNPLFENNFMFIVQRSTEISSEQISSFENKSWLKILTVETSQH